MVAVPEKILLCVVVALSLAACTTVRTRIDTAAASRDLAHASRILPQETAQLLRTAVLDAPDSAEASAHVLVAIERLWPHLNKDTPEHSPELLRLYNSLVEKFFSLNGADIAQAREPLEFKTSTRRPCRVSVEFRGVPAHRYFFKEFLPASSVRVRGFAKRSTIDGLGAALVASRDAELNEHFSPPRYGSAKAFNGLVVPAKNGQLRVVISDPARATTYRIKRTDFRLAADFTAPLAVAMAGSNDLRIGLDGLFRPEESRKLAGIYLAEPFDPDRIPVLLIHGLGSSPIIWRDANAQVLVNPDICKNYQFWYVFYPSAQPIPQSAANVRNWIKDIHRRYDPSNKTRASQRMVVVGYSMGGVIARSLSKDVGDNVWNAFFRVSPEEMTDVSESTRDTMARMLIWEPVPSLERGIYIAAPHKGAVLADSSPARLVMRLIEIPFQVVQQQFDLFNELAGSLRADLFDSAPQNSQTSQNSQSPQTPQNLRRAEARKLRLFNNSISSLSPGYPLFGALNESPTKPGFAEHSIIGNRNDGNIFRSSDGVVAYWSSHLPDAESEFIVRATHTNIYQVPPTIAELERILLENLGKR